MHMLMVIVCGTSPALGTATKVLIPVWIAISIVSPWVNVSEAGYTVVQEFPILLVVFAVPVMLAAVTICQYTHS